MVSYMKQFHIQTLPLSSVFKLQKYPTIMQFHVEIDKKTKIYVTNDVKQLQYRDQLDLNCTTALTFPTNLICYECKYFLNYYGLFFLCKYSEIKIMNFYFITKHLFHLRVIEYVFFDSTNFTKSFASKLTANSRRD